MINELLPFNLEEALKNPDRVVYRNGEKPLEWHWFGSLEEPYTLYSVTGDKELKSHKKNGRWKSETYRANYDLMLLPIPEKRYWVNVYDVWGYISISRDVYNSEEEAKINASSSEYYLKTISFTI